MEAGKPNIEGPFGAILNMVMGEMIKKDYPLKQIDTYITQVEKFLSTISSSSMDISEIKLYLTRTISTSSVEALHFFFREVLTSLPQETGYLEKLENHNLNIQDNSLYPILAL